MKTVEQETNDLLDIFCPLPDNSLPAVFDVFHIKTFLERYKPSMTGLSENMLVECLTDHGYIVKKESGRSFVNVSFLSIYNLYTAGSPCCDDETKKLILADNSDELTLKIVTERLSLIEGSDDGLTVLHQGKLARLFCFNGQSFKISFEDTPVNVEALGNLVGLAKMLSDNYGFNKISANIPKIKSLNTLWITAVQ